MSRRKLRNFCTQSIDIIWEKTIDNATYDADGNGVTAQFTDGTSYRGDLLVGADGPKSKVRELLLGVELATATPMEIIYNMSIIKYPDAEKALFVQAPHPHNLFGYNPNGIFNFLAGMYPSFILQNADRLLIMA
jgi:2-polyprenyl-6-methoxyphenol hydroxylase-like FAD-dependent oxidoreductase